MYRQKSKRLVSHENQILVFTLSNDDGILKQTYYVQ